MRARAGKVRSRHRATSPPSEPAASTAAAMSTIAWIICDAAMPPSSSSSTSTGMVATTRVPICNRLPTSLPRTISWSRRSVMSSRMKVRRSFSRVIGAGGGQGGEEERGGQLDVGDDLEEEQPEAGRVAERGGVRPADGRLPGGQAEHPEQAEVGRAIEVVARAARHRQPFAIEDGTEQRTSPSADPAGSRRAPTACASVRSRAGRGSRPAAAGVI